MIWGYLYFRKHLFCNSVISSFRSLIWSNSVRFPLFPFFKVCRKLVGTKNIMESKLYCYSLYTMEMMLLFMFPSLPLLFTVFFVSTANHAKNLRPPGSCGWPLRKVLSMDTVDSSNRGHYITNPNKGLLWGNPSNKPYICIVWYIQNG